MEKNQSLNIIIDNCIKASKRKKTDKKKEYNQSSYFFLIIIKRERKVVLYTFPIFKFQKKIKKKKLLLN